MAKKSSSLFETKYFGLLIGLLVFVLLFLIASQTVLISNLELNVLDFNFRLKNIARRTRVQEGVTLEQRNPKISPDILIIGSGAAGLRAAIEARRYGADVTVLDKLVIGYNNNSTFAGGGFKAALPGIMEADAVSQYNTPREHFIDTKEYMVIK